MVIHINDGVFRVHYPLSEDPKEPYQIPKVIALVSPAISGHRPSERH